MKVLRTTTFISIATASAFALATSSTATRGATETTDIALANDNRVAAGRVENDTLLLRLTIKPADWHILGDSQPAFRVLAFAEEGQPPTVPGPLIRVPVGTPTSIQVHNPLDDTLIVRGLSGRGGLRDSVLISPGDTAIVGSIASHVGAYAYWAMTATTRTSQPSSRAFRSARRNSSDHEATGHESGPSPCDA